MSALWGCVVIGIAAYEYSRFPIEPFATYLYRPDYSAYERAKEFHFINIKETPGIEVLSPSERELFEKYIREAKTESNRQQAIAARDLINYSAGVNWGSLLAAMFVPPIIFWLLCIIATKSVGWIAGGFKEKQ